MKNQDLLLSMNQIDDEYIAEAGPAALQKRKKIKKIISFAACMAVLVGLCLFLFVPYSTKAPGVEKYEDNEYFEVIEKLNQFFYTPSRFKNNFEAILYGLTSVFENGGLKGFMAEGADNAPGEPMQGALLDGNGGFIVSAESSTSGYEEVTDNQVKGVIEGDLFKRSGKYIFYLDVGTLKVYSIEGSDSKEVGRYVLQSYSYSEDNIMYLSEDCSTVTIIFNNYVFSRKDDVRTSTFSVLSLDVTDPQNIKLKKQVDFYGTLSSARLVDGKLYLVSGFVAKDTDDFENIKNFVPYTVSDGYTKYVSEECIYAPEKLSGAGYAVLTKLDEKTLKNESEYALLSFYNSVIYASRDSFYLARNYTDETEEDGYTVRDTMTEICRIGYSSGVFENLGSITLKGNVKDQYSMDEYNGILRVFASTDTDKIDKTVNGRYEMITNDTGVNASLYCVDINTLKLLKSVERFAPAGEDVKSARFDKDTAYVCTSVKFTDPVYFFDLSDLDNITYKETGTIEGYSTSLVDFGEGYLLGIGLKDWSTPKLEVYKEEGEKVVSVSAIGIPEGRISSNYKSYYIDRERGYVGLGVHSYNYSSFSNSIQYVIFAFENEELKVVQEVEASGLVENMRATYIDGYIYVLTEGKFVVIPEDDLK